MDSNKKKKILQICDPKEKDLYNRDLAKIVKSIYMRNYKNNLKKDNIYGKSLFIGHVLIAIKFKGRGIHNNNIIEGYKKNPLQLKDI